MTWTDFYLDAKKRYVFICKHSPQTVASSAMLATTLKVLKLDFDTGTVCYTMKLILYFRDANFQKHLQLIKLLVMVK